MEEPMKHLATLVVALAVISIVAAPAASAFDFAEIEKSVSEHTLDNGLKVIVMERHDAPVVSFVTYVDVGGVDDPKGYTGMAHMFEHMAFKGTQEIGTKDFQSERTLMKVEDSIFYALRHERSKGFRADSTKLRELEAKFQEAIDNANQVVVPNQFNNVMQQEGGVGLNAGTGMDQTSYIVSLPSNKLELWMAMESARFKEPVLREMYSERQVIAEERRQTLENNPIGRAIDVLKATAFTAHPYGISIVGHASDIQNYTRDEAKAFFNKYYVPSNMILAVVGDVKPKHVFELAEQYWGNIPYSPKPEPIPTVEPEQQGERRVVLEDPAQPFFAEGYHIPNYADPDFPALQAMMDYLGQGRTSLLYKKLVKEEKIAAMVGSFAGYPGSKYPSLALIYAMPSPDGSNEQCEEMILGEIQRLKDTLLTDKEVEEIKARFKASFINGLTSNLGMAGQLAGAQNDWGDWRALFRELDRINAVTAQDIQRVAKKYFTENNRTVVYLNTIQS
jgi:predicted Zn-dependent peptidase